jgi:hypothetical protein
MVSKIDSNISGEADIKKALAKAVKMRFADKLKTANEKERPFAKAYLAQMLHEKAHFDLALCNKALDALCAELFNDQDNEDAPQQDAQELAVPTNKKVASRQSGKVVYILMIIILVLLAVIAAGVWHKVWQLHTEPEVPTVQEVTTEGVIADEEESTTDRTDDTDKSQETKEKESAEQEVQTEQNNTIGDKNE